MARNCSPGWTWDAGQGSRKWLPNGADRQPHHALAPDAGAAQCQYGVERLETSRRSLAGSASIRWPPAGPLSLLSSQSRQRISTMCGRARTVNVSAASRHAAGARHVSPMALNNVISGKTGVSPKMALRLGRLFDLPRRWCHATYVARAYELRPTPPGQDRRPPAKAVAGRGSHGRGWRDAKRPRDREKCPRSPQLDGTRLALSTSARPCPERVR